MVKKKHHHEHHEEHADESWLIPYADILTLLLALFIVLFATSTTDKAKMAQIEYALAVAFNGVPAEQLSGNVLSFLDDVKDLDLGEEVGISTDANGAVLEIASINLFDKGSARIKLNAKPLLKQISALLSSNKYKRYRLIVEGHTDDALSSSELAFPSNWELSASRAGSVVRTLIGNGLSKNRFQAVGMADIAPAYPNLNAYGEPIYENQLRNRRVVIRIEF